MKSRLYSNENFPLPVVEALRRLGHDVLTTHNLRDYIRLHRENLNHAAMIEERNLYATH